MKYANTIGVALAFLITGNATARGQEVIVNSVRIMPGKLRALEALQGAKVPSGSYWYDPISGMWGRMHGPALGATLPNLNLGGRLRADASNGNTGVFVNGRQIHALELRYLQQRFGTVARGRYWLNSKGIGGFEGGPAQFNLQTAAPRQQRRSILSTRDLTGISVIGDRNGAVGVIGPGVGVTFGPGGPIYSR